MPDEQPTPEQQEEFRKMTETAIQWRDTKCPKGLLDPLTGALHPLTTAKIQAYVTANGDDVSFAGLDKAVLATWEQLIWFGNMPPKPGLKRIPEPPPVYEPPLRKCDKKRVDREYRESLEKQRKEVQKVIDEGLKKQKKAKEDERPKPVFYPDGHRFSGRIDHVSTQEALQKWKDAHGIFD